jgi:polygalacturonase
VGTNCLIQNCDISTGDDNIALGTSSSGVPAANILVTNCTFGDGHGMTIGSNTQGGVSNLTVITALSMGRIAASA